MQLSRLSRTTSISNSFQPSKDSSISNSSVGERSNPLRQISSNSSVLYAIPPPLPPRVNDGRITQGKPSWLCTCRASSMLWAIAERGVSRPIRFMARSKRSRSSALSIASLLAPINSTPNRSRIPSRTRSSVQFSAVCPPIVGNKASGRSLSMILATVGHSTGSM